LPVFISCGDILVDLFNQPTDAIGKVSLQGHVGGSPLNVAVGLSRLGQSTGYLCKNSTDFIGQGISEYIRANGIKSDWIISTSLNSTLAMIRKNPDGSANYAFYTDNTADTSLTIDELPSEFPDELAVLHFGSYSTAVEPICTALIALAVREAGKRVISYDPNLRPTVQPDMGIWRESFAQLAKVADFVKASDEDIGLLFGENTSFESFAVDTLALGAKAVAVTEGGSGATVYTADGRTARSAALSINVADTVGAGDTFQAASLHWLYAHGCIKDGQLSLDTANIQEWVDFAAIAAAITCTRAGADLPTLADIQQWQSSGGS
jgi:fructokinase